MSNNSQIEKAVVQAIRSLDGGNDSGKPIDVQDRTAIKTLRLWKGIAAIIFAAGSVAAWYRGHISEDIRREIADETNAAARVNFVDEKISEVNTRVDGVAIELDAFVIEQKVTNAAIQSQTSRTETMVEDLARKRGVSVPPKD